MDAKHHVYADNAATTRLGDAAWEAMAPYFREAYGNPSSLHGPGQRAKEAIERSRQTIARLLNADPRELFFTSGGSEADTQAIVTAARRGAQLGKRHVVSTAFEHQAVLGSLERLREEGFSITLLRPDTQGIVSAEEVSDALRDDTCLVSVMYANNEIGTIQPIQAIGDLCRRGGVLFHTDAVQAAGVLPVDVRRDRIDLLALSAHKFHGPKGVGVLFCRRDIPPRKLIRGGDQERGRRAGTENVPAIVGMAAAFEASCARQKDTAARVRVLRDRLIDGLSTIPRSRLNGERTRRLPGNVHFTFDGVEGEALLLYLDDQGVCASSGAACASGSLGPSHVLVALGRTPAEARCGLRLTLSEENTEAEVDYLITTVARGVERLRRLSPDWRHREA